MLKPLIFMKKQIVIILKEFPRVSETFIYQELGMLYKCGYHPIIFSLRVPRWEPTFNKLDSNPDIDIRYIPPFDSNSREEMRFLIRKLKKKYREELINQLASDSVQELVAGRGKEKFVTCHAAFRILENLDIVNPKDYHIHSQFLDQPAEIAYLIHKIAGVDYSISSHARDIYTTAIEDIKKVVGCSVGLKTCTQYNAKYLKTIVEESSKIRTVYHGVDCDFYCKGQEAEPIKLLSVGDFVQKNGYPYIFKALSKLCASYSNFIYTIIGHGKLEEECGNLIQSYHLEDKVVFIPHVSKSMERYYLKNSDIFISASIVVDYQDADDIPEGIAEAMSIGIPVIATDIPAISEIVIHKRTGCIATQKDAMSLFDCLMFYIKNPRKRKTLASNGMVHVNKHFQSNIMIEDCLTFYSEVLNK